MKKISTITICVLLMYALMILAALVGWWTCRTTSRALLPSPFAGRSGRWCPPPSAISNRCDLRFLTNDVIYGYDNIVEGSVISGHTCEVGYDDRYSNWKTNISRKPALLANTRAYVTNTSASLRSRWVRGPDGLMRAVESGDSLQRIEEDYRDFLDVLESIEKGIPPPVETDPPFGGFCLDPRFAPPPRPTPLNVVTVSASCVVSPNYPLVYVVSATSVISVIHRDGFRHDLFTEPLPPYAPADPPNIITDGCQIIGPCEGLVTNVFGFDRAIEHLENDTGGSSSNLVVALAKHGDICDVYGHSDRKKNAFCDYISPRQCKMCDYYFPSQEDNQCLFSH